MTIPIRVSYEQAVLALKKAVEELGEDYVYKRIRRPNGKSYCAYYDQNKAPSCIVGHVLTEIGAEPFEFDSDENTSNISRLETIGIVKFDDSINGLSKTATLLGVAQISQDTGAPWGYAVREATETAEKIP